MLRNTFLIGMLLICFTACKKNINELSETMEMRAKNVLMQKMAAVDYATLDWEHASVNKWNGKECLVMIPSKNDPGRLLYFSEITGAPVYNWAKIEVSARTNGKISGKLTTMDVNNNLLNQIAFINGKVVSQQNNRITRDVSSSGSKNQVSSEDLAEDLPPVAVTCYINSSTETTDYYSLFWLFNLQYDLLYLFQGGGGQIIDINSNEFSIGVPYKTIATRDLMADGSVQITATNTKAFLMSGLNLKFTYNPITKALNTNSVSSEPVGGIFLGSWTGPTVSGVVSTSTSIEFIYAYTNSYNLVGAPFSKEYKMTIKYIFASNEIIWQWLNN